MSTAERMLKSLLLTIVGGVALLVACEAAVRPSRRHPGRFPLLDAAARALYLRELRNVVQSDTIDRGRGPPAEWVPEALRIGQGAAN